MRNKYTFSEFLSNVYSLVLTKIFYKGARLIRRPVYIRGKKSLVYKSGFTLGHACRFDLPGDRQTLFIGSNCQIGDNTHIVAQEKVVIGNNVLMASKIFISDTSHGIYKGEVQDAPDTEPNDRQLVTEPVIIGDNVWIGENVVILLGSKIGNGCIIGANAVVSGQFEDNCMIVGIPARVIKKYVNGTWNHI